MRRTEYAMSHITPLPREELAEYEEALSIGSFDLTNTLAFSERA